MAETAIPSHQISILSAIPPINDTTASTPITTASKSTFEKEEVDLQRGVSPAGAGHMISLEKDVYTGFKN